MKIALTCILIGLNALDALAQSGGIPPEAQDAFQKGVVASEQREWSLAIGYFNSARESAIDTAFARHVGASCVSGYHRTRGGGVTPYIVKTIGNKGCPTVIDFYDEVPAILFNLGVAHANAGHDLPAIAWFYSYLAANPSGPSVVQVRREIGRLEVATDMKVGKLFSQVARPLYTDVTNPDTRCLELCSRSSLLALAGHLDAALKLIEASVDTGKVDPTSHSDSTRGPENLRRKREMGTALARVYYAWTRVRLGRFDEAQSTLDEMSSGDRRLYALAGLLNATYSHESEPLWLRADDALAGDSDQFWTAAAADLVHGSLTYLSADSIRIDSTWGNQPRSRFVSLMSHYLIADSIWTWSSSACLWNGFALAGEAARRIRVSTRRSEIEQRLAKLSVRCVTQSQRRIVAELASEASGLSAQPHLTSLPEFVATLARRSWYDATSAFTPYHFWSDDERVNFSRDVEVLAAAIAAEAIRLRAFSIRNW